jgi:hypothetical protein
MNPHARQHASRKLPRDVPRAALTVSAGMF